MLKQNVLTPWKIHLLPYQSTIQKPIINVLSMKITSSAVVEKLHLLLVPLLIGLQTHLHFWISLGWKSELGAVGHDKWEMWPGRGSHLAWGGSCTPEKLLLDEWARASSGCD